MTSLAFVYVVDGPRLQAQALILAASLRHHQPTAEQFAYCPKETLNDLPRRFREHLERQKVQITALEQSANLFAQPYPHGNKILALAAERPKAIHSVFLDTDMVMVKPIDVNDLPGKFEVSVVPEGIRGWGKDEQRWQRAYEHFNLAMPKERIRLLRGRRAMSPPYFNGGFVAVNEQGRVENRRFGELWRDTASDFDHHAPLGGKRPWLDQITLPLTMARFGFVHKILPETNNCSISNGRDLSDLGEAKILHYHRSAFLRAWPDSDAIIASALAMAPADAEAELAKLLQQEGFTGPMPVETRMSEED